MSLVDHLNQNFDLDMALTTSATTENPGGDDETTKLSDSIASKQNHQFELPIVAALGVCTVCMEGFKPSGEGEQVPCGHIFHGTCIDKWLSLHNSCPLCRFDIATAAVHSVNSF